MVRNLDHRIEATCPINNNKLKLEIKDILKLQWSDNVKARILDNDLLNNYKPEKPEKKIRSQIEIMKYLAHKTEK
jgi:polyphosphate kinase